MKRISLSTNGHGITQAMEEKDGTWSVEHLLPAYDVRCLASDPRDSRRVYAGTQGRGMLSSADGGCTWTAAGLDGCIVKSIAVSHTEPGVVYAGCKPPRLLVSRDRGMHWSELEAFRAARSRWWRSPAEPDWGAYIQSIALSPADPNVIIIGIEAGAVLRTADGGNTWQGHRPGALRDCHTLAFHGSDGGWVYEAGGTGAGASVSRDGGRTWKQPGEGLDRHYGWACAADPARPEVWYVSAAPAFAWSHPFQPPAHVDGQANAFVFRSVGGAPWQRLGGGLPQPLTYMAYGLVTDAMMPGHLYAGLSNGDMWHTANYGDTWERLPLNLRRIERSLIMLRDEAQQAVGYSPMLK